MLTPSKKYIPQLGLFTGLADQLNQKHPLYELSHKIDWSFFENAFKIYYSETMGKPSKPIRLMVSLLILKYVRNLSDESLVELWSENNYYQYFSGEQHFRPSIGHSGMLDHAVPCPLDQLVVLMNIKFQISNSGR